MSRLLRLYPAAWRERYEAEFIGTLQERSVGVAGSVDIVRGAIDAHLHPELTGGTPHVWTYRLPGVVATVAGLIWSWYLIHVFLAAPNEEWGDGIWIALVLMFAAVGGDYLGAYLRHMGLAVIGIIALIVLSRTLPWSAGNGVLNLTAGVASWLMVGVGMLTLAAIRAGIGAKSRWLLAGAVLVLPAIIAIPVMGGFGPSDPGGVTAMLVAALPYGIAWLVVGLRMSLRGAETMPPRPEIEQTPEVAAA